MTVTQLVQRLLQLPQDIEVVLDGGAKITRVELDNVKTDIQSEKRTIVAFIITNQG
jgi:hypothetical protein